MELVHLNARGADNSSLMLSSVELPLFISLYSEMLPYPEN